MTASLGTSTAHHRNVPRCLMHVVRCRNSTLLLPHYLEPYWLILATLKQNWAALVVKPGSKRASGCTKTHEVRTVVVHRRAVEDTSSIRKIVEAENTLLGFQCIILVDTASVSTVHMVLY